MIGTTTMAANTTVMAGGVQYAAPATYATQAYAAPVTYAAAPAAVTTGTPSYVAQPQYTTQAYAAPITAGAASYVAQPQYAMAAPQMIAAAGAPVAPPKLTEGIPTPQQIAAQKAQYAAALDKQLADAISTVKKETEIEKQMVKFTSDKNVSLYNMSVDEQLAEQIAIVDEQATIQSLELKKALVERNLQLNAQAQGLTMDYQMKAVQTELAMKQYEFQLKYVKEETKLAEEYRAQAAKANVAF